LLKRLAHRFRFRLTFANVVALLALFLALAGTSFGRDAGTSAISGAKKALGLSKKADRNSRKALKLARQADRNASAALAKAGVPGPSGAPGTAGAPGSAIAYAGIEYCPGACDDQPTAGWFAPDEDGHSVDNQINFSNPSPGVFCFSNLLPEVHNVVVSMAPSSSAYLLEGRVGSIDHPIGSPCTAVGGAQHNAVVEVHDPSNPAVLKPPDHADRFVVVFN
jgi:hypothetical protein